MNISVTYVIDYHYLDVRQYLDDILYVPRVYRVTCTITQFCDHYEWSEFGEFLLFERR